VTLTRLEKAGLVTATAEAGQDRPDRPDRPDRKVYELTATGQQRVAGAPGEWSSSGRSRLPPPFPSTRESATT
jgi:DNA-binding PadR family transcriptional regulator